MLYNWPEHNKVLQAMTTDDNFRLSVLFDEMMRQNPAGNTMAADELDMLFQFFGNAFMMAENMSRFCDFDELAEVVLRVREEALKMVNEEG